MVIDGGLAHGPYACNVGYYIPKEQKEPGGCMQSLILTRAVFSILFVPLLILLGALFALIVTLYAFTISPPLALVPIGIGGGAIYLLYRFEQKRVESEMPRDD